VGSFDGMVAEQVDGRPAAVVWHTSAADPQANGGQPVKVTTVYGPDGSVLWDSAGRSRIAHDRNGYPVFSAGFTLTNNDDGTADVVPTTRAVVLPVPGRTAVTLAAGPALATTPPAGGSAGTVVFTLSDLA